MQYDREFANYDCACNVVLTLDFAAHRIVFASADGSVNVDATYPSIEAMNEAYQTQVASYLRRHNCYDIEAAERAEPIADLAALAAELQASEPIGDLTADTPLDALVAKVTNGLRKRLNNALGAEPIRLGVVVFCWDESGITGVIINPPLMAGVADEALDDLLKRHPYGEWTGDDFRPGCKWNFETQSPIGGELADYGDGTNLFDRAVGGLIELAVAKLQADPGLRTNVDTTDDFRAFVSSYGEDDLGLPWREIGSRHVSGGAHPFFTELMAWKPS